MLKTIILTLKKIKYTGRAIGDDIRVEIETSNHFLAIEKKIQRGGTIDFTTEIGQIVTNQKSLTIPLTVRVIEQDILFNDVGSSQKNLKISLATRVPQSEVYQVSVAEARGYTTKKIANFEVTIEVQVFQGMIRYVDDTKDGWLNVKPEHGREDIGLPKHIKVLLYKTDVKREYFTIMEGVLRGSNASVALKSKTSSYLSSRNPHGDAVEMSYSISKKIFKFQGKNYKAVDHPGTKWKKGVYDIELPDHPHLLGRNYPDIRYATSWFRIGHIGDRYLHAGSLSLGCITLIEHDIWDRLYTSLVKARKGDGMSIGTLTIID